MATLANIFDRLMASGSVEEAAAVPANESGLYRLREFPGERIHLYVKRFDNTRVVRQVDPRSRGVCWRFIGGACLGALLLVGLFLPSAWSLLAGYQIHTLKLEQERLINERATLENEEATLLSPSRLEELARIQQFIDPAPDQVVHLHPKSDVALHAPAR